MKPCIIKVGYGLMGVLSGLVFAYLTRPLARAVHEYWMH